MADPCLLGFAQSVFRAGLFRGLLLGLQAMIWEACRPERFCTKKRAKRLSQFGRKTKISFPRSRSFCLIQLTKPTFKTPHWVRSMTRFETNEFSDLSLEFPDRVAGWWARLMPASLRK